MLPPQLITGLLDLLAELDPLQIPITLGGGLGLYLKRMHFDKTQERTLLNTLPDPRGTNDLDVFIRAEVLADLSRTKQIAKTIQKLGYMPIEGSFYWQWVKQASDGEKPGEVKIDLLVGPTDEYEDKLKRDDRRVRPKGEISFHARRTDEALGIDENQISIVLTGKLSTGTDFTTKVHVPQAFSYLMMKACAFHDRKNDKQSDGGKDLGKHHALDFYTTVALMTEAELHAASELVSRFETHKQLGHVRTIIKENFSAETQLGCLRIREHALYRDTFQLVEFIEILRDLFKT